MERSPAPPKPLPAFLAFGLAAPLGKLLLQRLSPFLLATLVCLGAGLGAWLCLALGAGQRPPGRFRPGVGRTNLPILTLLITLGTVAWLLFFVGLSAVPASSAALLLGFQVAASALLSLAIFRKAPGQRLWAAIVLITIGAAVLSLEDIGGLMVSPGALCVLCAAQLWGLGRNCQGLLDTGGLERLIPLRSLWTGILALMLSLAFERIRFDLLFAILAVLGGLLTAGLSSLFQPKAGLGLRAGRAGILCAAGPLAGVALSFLALGERPALSFYPALFLIILGLCLSAKGERA
jgi:drug/metabolite transporter (DMT)-like permease